MERHRQPKVGHERRSAAEIGWCNADDGDADAVQRQASPKQTWISRESPLPEGVADDRYRLSSGDIVFWKEGPPQCRAHTEYFEIVRRNPNRPRMFAQCLRRPKPHSASDPPGRCGGRRADASHGECAAAVSDCNQSREGPIVVAIVRVVRIR